MDNYSTLDYTKQTIRETHQGKQGSVFTNYILAPFIEFGTGVKGKNAPHPKASEFDWKYIRNKANYSSFQTESGNWIYGWYYPSRIDDPNTLKIDILDDEGNPTGEVLAFTQGMPSRPFMYNTYRYLLNHYMDIAKETFTL